MKPDPLHTLQELGQSIWYDNIRRGMLENGAIAGMIAEGAITGITSNPTIFEKAIGGTSDYDEALRNLLDAGGGVRHLKDIFEQLAIEDIRCAADLLRPVYDRTRVADGYVSFEVSPELARDTAGTIAEARRLFAAVGRPNVMIKVPATDEGMPAITALVREGVNVNATLLFSLKDYRQVAAAYLQGIEDRAADGRNLSGTASVASFFVSRTDTAADRLLPKDSPLRGKIAVANASAVFAEYRRTFQSARFQALAAKGAQVQRLLWASTGTKNPAYSDVLYVEELIGPGTINTMPQATLDAFRDHGRPRVALADDPRSALRRLAELKAAGIDLDKITAAVKEEGVAAFARSFGGLIAALEEKCAAISADRR